MNVIDLVLQLQHGQTRELRHIAKAGLVFGWDSYNLAVRDLEAHDLVRGSWTGSLSQQPRPMWQITQLGEQVLQELEARELRERNSEVNQ